MGLADGANGFAYVHNDPINRIDRLGYVTEGPEDVVEGSFAAYFYGSVENHCYCERHRTCKRGGDLSSKLGNLPGVDFADYFEKSFPLESSHHINLGRPEYKDRGIGFVNGVWNRMRDAQGSAEYLSRLANNHNVQAVYNASHGFCMDLVECEMGLRYQATEPVRQLHGLWDDFFQKSSQDAHYLMFCHSQGAIHVRNALLAYPPSLRRRIRVVAIAPAAYIYRETCAAVVHYRMRSPWRDLVPRIDSGGAERVSDTIIELASHPNASLFDHNFSSPSYRRVIRDQINGYLGSE